ncbi:MAG TPA: AIM24 family protein, partial [Geminicoccaceae bacterium]
GSGWVAVVSDGPPVLLTTGEAQTFCDPQAAITWSSNLQTHVKADVNMKSLIGKGSGESLQLGFVGQGWVLVQPSEGRAGAPAAGSGGGGGLLGNLGG